MYIQVPVTLVIVLSMICHCFLFLDIFYHLPELIRQCGVRINEITILHVRELVSCILMFYIVG